MAPDDATDETPTATLESIEVVTEPDDHPELSYLGEFTDEPGPDDRTIDRHARGVQGHGEKRYFVAAHSPEETGNPDSVEQDWERMEAYGRSWHQVGVKAVATVSVSGTTQTLSSSGLWGIESDASADHFERVARGELAELTTVLDAVGVEVPATVEWADDAVVSGTVTVEGLDMTTADSMHEQLTPTLMDKLTQMVKNYAADEHSEYTLLYVVGTDLPTDEMLYTEAEYEPFEEEYADYDPPDDLYQLVGHTSDGQMAMLYAPRIWELVDDGKTLELYNEPTYCHETTRIPMENVEVAIGLDGFIAGEQKNPLVMARTDE